MARVTPPPRPAKPSSLVPSPRSGVVACLAASLAALAGCGDGGGSSQSSTTSSGGAGGTGGATTSIPTGGGGSATTTTTTSGTSVTCGDGACTQGETCGTCAPDCGPCCDGATCCGNGVCDPGESCATCAQDCTDAGGAACPRVGMFYLGWHQPAYTAVQATIALGKPVLTVEDVLRSRVESGAPPGPVYSFDQILAQNGLDGVAANFYYQATPAEGPYCLVHARSPGALNYDVTHEGTYGSGPVPDCPKYAETLARHAEQLTSAGVDYVVTDQTNIADYNAFGDAIQLRPFEVMLEEWRALRKSGVRTPDIAAWQRLSAPGTMAPRVLAVYNAPENDRMIPRDPATGKKLFFYPDLDDVDPALVAAVNSNGGKNDILAVPMWVYKQAKGSWSFFAACQQGALLDDAPCAQTATLNSVVGSQLAVSPSYQLSYASLPFQAVGVYNGVTLRKQFETAFAVKPHWLFLSGWNEQVAQPQSGAPGASMGLETDPTAADRAFVDTYGAEFSRDIEPSKEYGSLIYDLVKSCVRVYRSGSATCDNPDEACCQGGNWSDRYAAFDGPQGRFVLYSTKLGEGAGRSALYHCVAGASDAFFSPDAGCEGTAIQGQVGFVSTVKGGETLRALRRCFGPSGHAYSLTASCPAGTSLEAVLGYVR